MFSITQNKEGKGKGGGNMDVIIVEFPLETKSVCSEDFTFKISRTINDEDDNIVIDLAYTQFLQNTPIHLASFCRLFCKIMSLLLSSLAML